jgi:hypothetical protein
LILDQIQEALTTVYDNISEQKLALSSKQKDLDNKSKRLFDLVLN